MVHLQRRVVTRLDESLWHAAAAAAITGAAAGLIEYVVMSRHVSAAVDAVIMGIIAAVLVYMVLAEARARRKILLQHLRAVAELNHEVRNALQTIVYSKFLPPQVQTEAVLESVNRIENTLRELFPGVIARPEDGVEQEAADPRRKPPAGTAAPRAAGVRSLQDGKP